MNIKFNFSGLKVSNDLKLDISDSLNHFEPFALKCEEGYTAIFVPKQLMAIFINDELTVQQCEDATQFMNLVGLTVITHRQFIKIEGKLLQTVEKLLN